MSGRLHTFKLTVIGIIFFIICFWLLATSSGLSIILQSYNLFVPEKHHIEYAGVQGSIIEGATIYNVRYGRTELLEASLHFFSGNFQLKEVINFGDLLPNYIKIDEGASELNIVTGNLGYNAFSLNLRGTLNAAPLAGHVSVYYEDNLWRLTRSNLTLGPNKFIISPNKDIYQWQLDLSDPQLFLKESRGGIFAAGKMEYVNRIATITAHASASNFQFQDLVVRDLSASLKYIHDPSQPLTLKATVYELEINSLNLHKTNVDISGTPSNHQLKITSNINQLPTTITSTGSFTDLSSRMLWISNNIVMTLGDDHLTGKAFIANNKWNLKLNGIVRGATTTINSELNSEDTLKIKYLSYLDDNNNSSGYINFSAANSLYDIRDYKIRGHMKTTANNLNIFSEIFPDLDQIKGSATSIVDVDGSILKPKIKFNAKITKLQARITKLGIKLNPVELAIRANESGKFILDGYGYVDSKKGKFSLHGFIEPFKEGTPNGLQLLTENAQFINNYTAKLQASSNLKLKYDFVQHILDVDGDITLEKGKINFKPNKDKTIKTRDVVFVDNLPQSARKFISINPNLNIRILNEVYFSGFNLDTNITGKLQIYKANDTLFGDGRISLKSGTYKLPSQKLYISHGRLLFPPGTILTNPSLDIQMLANKNTSNSEVGLYVQGNIQKPVIHETGMTGNNEKALSQAFGASTGILPDDVTDSLGLAEFGITGDSNNNGQGFFDDPASEQSFLENKSLVIGKQLSERFYLQYMQSMRNATNTFSLKYSLGRHWAIGFESGTYGKGADISFFFETD